MRSPRVPHVPRVFLASLGALVVAAPLAWSEPLPALPCAPPCPSPCAPARPLITYPQVLPTPAPSTAPTTAPEQRPTPAERPSPATEAEPLISPPPVAAGRSAAGLGEQVALTSNAAYIDSAVPVTQFRLRFDAAYDDNRPDRDEFFYPKCGCFHTPDARGPAMPETKVDYQEVSSYLEYAVSPRFSAFFETTYRSINPTVNPNEDGFGDLNTGFKWAFLYQPDSVGTFQFRTYIPTGLGRFGLGTDHVSLEPALLFLHQFGNRVILEAELRDWIPIGGSDFAGNVLRYGIGLSYDVIRTDAFRLAPVGELVGWTALSGKESDATENVVVDSAGHTIVNAKMGVRLGFGETTEPGLLNRSDFFVGYARALTGDVWYKDALRVEFRYRF